MRRLYWNSVSFAGGVHRYPSRSAVGEMGSAGDMRNLRVDGEGCLRLRNAVPVVLPAGRERRYTGVGLSGENLWVLRSGELRAFGWGGSASERLSSAALDGRRVRVPDDLAKKLEGRLWVLDEFSDFMIGTSEGSDFGFWVDVRGDEFSVHGLGLLPPAVPDLVPGSESHERLKPGLYVYALTSVRAFFKHVNRVSEPPEVLGKEFSGRDVLFNGMESEPAYFVVRVDETEENPLGSRVVGDFNADGERITSVAQLPYENGGIGVSGVTYDDVQQTGIYVYQAQVRLLSEVFRYRVRDVEDLEFRLVDFFWRENPGRGGAPDVGRTLVSIPDEEDEGVLDKKLPTLLMRRDNQRLPGRAFMLEYFNGRLFAPVGDELRYSDVRDGVPVQWAWPVSNSIRVQGEIVFCVEHRGVLLFGGAGGIWRLTGVDEYSFDVEQVSGIGPVSRGAWGRFSSGIGFIGSGGFYVTDGVSVQQVSSPALDGYFERTSVGAVEDTVIRVSIPGVDAVNHVNVGFVGRIESRGRFVTEVSLVSPPRGKEIGVLWDGRDGDGELQVPGTYEFVLYGMVAGDVLDRYGSVLFELAAADNEIVDGAVTLLPNDDWLWSVRRADGVSLQFLRSSEGGGWFVWRVGDISQFASGQVAGSARVVCVDGDVVREVLWDDFTVGSDGEGAIGWRWQSQEIDFSSDGFRGESKLFMWLEVFGYRRQESVTVRMWVDGVSLPEVDVVFRGRRPVRVPIGRRGEQLRFEVFGEGDVVLRHFRLVAGVADRLS